MLKISFEQHGLVLTQQLAKGNRWCATRAFHQWPTGFTFNAAYQEKVTREKSSTLGLTSSGEMLHVPHDPLGVGSWLVVVHLPCHHVRDSGSAAANGTRGAVQALGVLLPQRHDAAVHVLQDVALCRNKGTALAPTHRSHSSAGCKTYSGKPTLNCLKVLWPFTDS